MVPVVQLIDFPSGQIVLDQLRLATRFWSRFRGLQLAAPLSPNEGLLLSPCRSVHTHFMRFPLDIYFCSDAGIVLSRHLNAQPWRCMAVNRKASFVIETAAQPSPVLSVGQMIRLRWAERESSRSIARLASITLA
ncbi:DUF192 domain-containing protein [Blastopirellula marina]|uniref:DUF192 domain-containing protein n=1 Tax=Blastopirellula marina TaxID=124 RepID=A0A2S8G0T1_9BACT|nr:hypothetical protein C5Y98_08155 [Blastopirellula marina]PTL44703.1 DUF192 domain-containing protein [Blastopirellula marina]